MIMLIGGHFMNDFVSDRLLKDMPGRSGASVRVSGILKNSKNCDN
jgi:hypothetical protein